MHSLKKRKKKFLSSHFVLNYTPLLRPLMGENRLSPHFPSAGAMKKAITFSIHSSNFPPVRT
jgi:hypothetical protein